MRLTGLKLTCAAAALLGLGATAYADDTAAAAPAAPDWGKVSAYVAVQSDYRFRGISQNDRNIDPEGSINWSGPMGFYAGTWVAKTNWSGVAYSPTDGASPTVEVDLYGGKHFDLDGTDLNIEAYYYSYPDANKNILLTYASYYETIVQLSHTFDKLTLTATGANSPEWSLHGGTAWYAEGTASYALDDWLSVSGNLGHQWVQRAPSDYTHWDIGATATWKSWSLDVRYIGNDISKANCSFWIGTGTGSCADTVVATLTFNISDLFQ
ncbi:MAG TPA: TorF family putative porin [Rhizomicrobium sp.]|nr:TorF family putative porin [Rhizomicrobium sp.]